MAPPSMDPSVSDNNAAAILSASPQLITPPAATATGAAAGEGVASSMYPSAGNEGESGTDGMLLGQHYYQQPSNSGGSVAAAEEEEEEEEEFEEVTAEAVGQDDAGVNGPGAKESLPSAAAVTPTNNHMTTAGVGPSDHDFDGLGESVYLDAEAAVADDTAAPSADVETEV